MTYDIEKIKDRIDNIVDLEKKVIEEFSIAIDASHAITHVQSIVINKMANLALYYVESGQEFGEEYFLLQKALNQIQQPFDSSESLLESRIKSMKVLSDLKRASGVSSNNTVQPQLITFVNEIAK